MKRYIPFLSLLIIAFGMNVVNASECVDEDCDLASAEYTETATVVDVLEPVAPKENIWYDFSYQSSKYDTDNMCDYDYNCPFETIQECEVWYKKPVHKTNVLRRSAHLSPVKVDDIIFAINLQPDFSANDVAAKSLMERYKILMRTSKACCTAGFITALQNEGAKEDQIYEFLKDDANNFAVGQRCVVLSNNDITGDYSYGVDGEMVADVRNRCLCRNKKWFNTLLQPFNDIYERAPQFASDPFYYTYRDSMKRTITVSVNQDVQNVLDLLEYCPD